MLTAAAPGKIILFGEHAVVYGQPAIAVPLAAVEVRVSAMPAPAGSGIAIHAPESHVTLQYSPEDRNEPFHNALIYPLQLALAALGRACPDLELTVRSTIPMASGLGSGAALATALIRALAAAVGEQLSVSQVNALVYEVEKRHHGTPSGIDNTVIVFGQPVYFVRGQPTETFTIASPFTLLVVDTGRPSPTHVAVGDVRKLWEHDPARIEPVFDAIGAIARQARAAIESGAIERLGPLMRANHRLLRELTVSSDELDRLVGVAEAAGAAGAKLSGGGRGGNLIALVDPERAEQVSAALRDAGAVRVIQTTVASSSRDDAG